MRLAGSLGPWEPLQSPFAKVCSPVSRSRQSINVPLTLRFGSEKARMVSVLITFLVFASVGFLKGLNAGSPAGAAAFPALLLPAALTVIATAVSIPLSLKFYRENR